MTDKQKRLIIFKNSNGKCEICGKSIQNDNPKDIETYMTLDHIIPKSKGGTRSLSNFRPLCRKCNMDRGAKDIDNGLKIKRNNTYHFLFLNGTLDIKALSYSEAISKATECAKNNGWKSEIIRYEKVINK